jgi:ATP-binding cassette subfamily D (ALD) long-chain fatty acid import protein
LITISHKPSLLKHHKYLLKLTGEQGRWELSELRSREALMSVDVEIKDLEAKVREEAKLRQRITEVNALLGVKPNATKK